MVVTCDIQFENSPEATYYAGQVITGKITLTADKSKQVKAVNLIINGTAKTQWTESRGTNRRNRRSYSAQIDYINTVTCLLSPKASEQSAIIEPGIHTFSFACHLPINCPSSFEGLHGSIRYVICVTLVRPWKFDQSFTRAFTVLSIIDLNYGSPLLRLPVKSDITKTFCCGVCKSKPLKIVVQLPQAGYVPGQLIPVDIWITNDTSSSINEVCVRLLMIINYFCTVKNATKSETKIISVLKGDPVLRYCRKNFNYLLPVPATPPSCTTLCRFIHITYRVEVEAKMQGILYPNQCVRTPVTIGNVPLQMQGMIVQQQPMPRQLNFENAASEMTIRNSATTEEQKLEDSTVSNENVEPWSAIGNISPPVYTEARHIPRAKLCLDSDHEYGETSYAPKYPVFDFPSPTSYKPNQHADEIDGHNAAVNRTTWL